MNVVETFWPLILLGLRIAVAGLLYLFLFSAFRALRAELRSARAAPPVPAPAEAPLAAPTAPEPARRRRRAPATPAAPASTAPVAASAVPDGPAWLEIVAVDGRSDLAGQRFALDGAAVIGRGSNSDVRIADPRLSRRHARLVRRDGAWWVEDLESTNGTYVGSRRVAGAARLNGGGLRFGPVEARIATGRRERGAREGAPA